MVKSLRKHFLALWKEKMNITALMGNFKHIQKWKLASVVKSIWNWLGTLSSVWVWVCKFRVSSHHLQIELGRYQGIPRHQRLCQQCSSGEVEDEIHFLFKCTKYEPDRKELIDIILNSCPNFNSLNNVKKLEWICNCENHNILTHLGVFLRKHCR